MTQQGLFDKPEEKQSRRLIRDPAVAAAVSKCIINTIDGGSALALQAHPLPCRFCKYPYATKMASVEEFNAWAGLTKPVADDWPALETTVEAFMKLPREEQARLATVAAGYTPNEFGEPLLAPQHQEWQDKLIAHRRAEPGKRKESYGMSMDAKGSPMYAEGGSISGQPVIDDKKAPSAGTAGAVPQPVDRRDSPGDGGSGRVGGTEAPTRAARRGIPDPKEEAPESDEADLSVSPDYPPNYHPEFPF